MLPGEYLQSYTRKAVVQVPVISGYVAARLQAQDWIQPSISGVSNTNMFVTYENVGNTFFSVRLQATTDRSISGVRTVLANSSLMVAPGGQATFNTSTKDSIVEVFCTGTTNGSLRMQIDSQRRWNEMSMDKIDPYYPTVLWQAKEYPGPLST